MLNKKLLIILVVVLVIALVVAGVLIFLSKRQADNNINNINNVGENILNQTLPKSGGEDKMDNQPGENINIGQPVIDPKEQAKTDALNMAKFFVEMIGSYSPASRLQNVIDAQPMMTKSMVAWSEDFLARNSASLDNNQESITTKVLKNEFLVVEDERLRLILTTRRAKTVGGVETNYSQDAEVEVVRSAGAWKINNLIWK